MHYKSIIAFTLILFIQACSEEGVVQESSEIIRPVKTFSVTNKNTETISSFPGVIESRNLQEISFLGSGRVINFPITEAMAVKQGELLAELDQRDLNNKLSQAQAEYRVAEDEYQRLAKLSKTGAVSKSSLQVKRTERDVAKVQLDIAQEARNDAALVAPFDGVIAQTFIEKDQVVSGGQTIAILIGEGELEASIDVPDKFLASLHQSAKNDQSVRMWVSLSSNPDMHFPAEFKEATLVADPTTQTFGLTFAFEPLPEILVLPGMNVSVSIAKQENNDQNTFFVPLDSIGQDVNGEFVWLIEGDTNTVTKRVVEIGDSVGDNIAIVSGLNQGDTIVSAGVSQLLEGVKVRKWMAE
ncbi:efflux RND transporter periplasmic adaptor subunit [Vibrio chaetopteri]|uniref:Efflux RND transporter periplasmic adaptor subunit n=1 Tax=Vibrio chaetopteri TaxID=3016528 RepID=A0AAU8BRM5_9VIBR